MAQVRATATIHVLVTIGNKVRGGDVMRSSYPEADKLDQIESNLSNFFGTR